MPRAALRTIVGTALALAAATAAAVDPHVDPSLLPNGCAACHKGHGAPGSPMLPATQREVCLACHDSRVRADREVRHRNLSPSAAPTPLSPALAQAFTHPMTDAAFSKLEPDTVTCTSCHSPHRGRPEPQDGAVAGTKKRSTRDPARFEFELCRDCHGSDGVTARSVRDLGRAFNPNSRSYHPVQAPSNEGSPSVLPSLAGREINCTDCHGNSDRGGPRGPHGSSVPFLLVAPYVTTDGNEESPAAYGLCYGCHRREQVLDSPLFPEHRRHVVEARASCATCHDAHGSVGNRALVRFGDDGAFSAASPSTTAGILAYESQGPGAGACFLTCHGHDHAPATYGGISAATTAVGGALGATVTGDPSSPPRLAPSSRPASPRPRVPRKR